MQMLTYIVIVYLLVLSLVSKNLKSTASFDNFLIYFFPIQIFNCVRIYSNSIFVYLINLESFEL